jgi:hypothetical protein
VCLFFFLLATIATKPTASAMMVHLMQVFQVYLSFCIMGNFMSLLLPYRVGADAMRSARKQWAAALVGFVSLFLIPILMLPTILCMMLDTMLDQFLGYSGIPIGPVVSAAFLAITVLVYRATTASAGRLLAEREERIMERLSRGEQ